MGKELTVLATAPQTNYLRIRGVSQMIEYSCLEGIHC
jgi:hypothetical protein